jgi:hypothetical protein
LRIYRLIKDKEKHMRPFTIILAAVFSLLFAGSLFAQGPVEDGTKKGCPPYDEPGKTYDPSPIPDAIDTNRDGIMTHEEWKAAGAPEPSWNMFMEKDKQKKGYITREEFIAETPPDGIDANCDGYITIWEFLATKKWAPPEGAPGSKPK